ncbi:acid protease [Russula ochroleuca]|uniref:Acid protease n=1 Tax=Russula ochroleuca TaxID=152965 RepID=A0A9P5K0F8_9AGAM|nr:acid protease [Russula ochroleuca]
MYFSIARIAVTLAALPFLVGAVPVQKSKRNTLSVPLSKRFTHRDADGVVSVPNLLAGVHHTTVKFRRGFEAFERNTGEPHPLAPKHGRSDKRSDPGIVPLTDFHSFMWSGTIQAGTPSKEYSVDIDTGSAILFLPGPSCQSCQGLTIYDPSNSTTAKDLGQSTNLTFSIGSVFGNVFTDTINLGGFEASNEKLVVASNVTTNFNATNFGADGILGMGFSGISPFNGSTVFENLRLADGEQLPEQVFGIVLAESNSELIIGGRDSSRFEGNLTYTPDTTQGFWQIKLDNITINGNDTHIGTKEAVIDTGTTQILGDHESIANIYANIPGSALNTSDSGDVWTFPCNTTVNASLVFGNTTFKISPDKFSLGPVSQGSDLCLGGFGDLPALIRFWVIGDVFLQNVYAEFDYENVQVGFAQLTS